MYLKEIIKDDYKKWKNGDNVIFDCGTGTGKTTFCIETLGNYAQQNNKKILYLCNRIALKDEISSKAEELHLLDNTIVITTYQKLQEDIKNNIPLKDYYDYIIADECHYFTADSYNEDTDLSFNFCKEANDSVVIYMSATASKFFEILQKRGRVKQENVYSIPKDYSYVSSVYFYKKKELVPIIRNILNSETESKILFICSNGERLLELYLEFQDCAYFVCSNTTTNKRLAKICDYSVINNQSNTFDRRILFATTTLDNGISLKDPLIKHIFVELLDIDILEQALGRKRPIDKNDTCKIYIKDYNYNRDIKLIHKLNDELLEPARFFKHDNSENKKEFRKKYLDSSRDEYRKLIRKNDVFIYEGTSVHVNGMIYTKKVLDSNYYERIRNSSYKEVVLNRLGKEMQSKSSYLSLNLTKSDSFICELFSRKNKKLFKDDQKALKGLFKSNGCTSKNIGLNTMNGWLKDNYPTYNFRIISDRERKRSSKNRDKTYWMIIQDNEII